MCITFLEIIQLMHTALFEYMNMLRHTILIMKISIVVICICVWQTVYYNLILLCLELPGDDWLSTITGCVCVCRKK